jgi:hypothetical protein
MTFPSEYHSVVKDPVSRPIPAALALFGMLSLSLLLVSSSPAQTNSSASSGAGHAVGATPSVAASTPNTHVSANSSATASAKTSPATGGSHVTGGHPPQPTNATQLSYPYYYYPFVYVVPAPYPVDVTDNGPSDSDPDYQGGPTIFDRRGSGPASYVPPVSPSPDQELDSDAAQDMSTPDSNSDPEPSPAPTILIFKDGHELDIDNYAIVSQTLYDLTPGHPRKIALADLDLTATQKQNDDHGITFDLPTSAQAN